ncbi:MAG: hypothetical protein IT428_12215 [Planctomycetaceae bacterium]|nr:hypothetical protein [Planctomycetaceae bacterium]
MDSKKRPRWQEFRRDYFSTPAAKPRWKREPYSLGAWFDIAVAVALAIAVIGNITG